MYKYLPSKKFILTLISIFIAVGIIYLFSFLSKPKKVVVNTINTETQAKIQEFMALDSDSDGMKDWEESLWKTDSKNPDTDGDGTSDSEEIRANRDPLKQNINPSGQEPSDKIDPDIIAQDKKITDDFLKLSNTDRVSRSLFSQYLATKKVGGVLSATDQQNIILSTLANLSSPIYLEYSRNDITALNTTDSSAIKSYGNQVAEIILRNLTTKTADVYTVIGDYTSSEVETAPTEPLKNLDSIIAKNQLTVNSLLKVQPPLEAVDGHLILTNIFYKIVQDLTAIKNAPQDIINTLVIINQYQSNVTLLSDILVNLTQYIFSTKNNIQYANNEYGYQLFNAIIMKK